MMQAEVSTPRLHDFQQQAASRDPTQKTPLEAVRVQLQQYIHACSSAHHICCTGAYAGWCKCDRHEGQLGPPQVQIGKAGHGEPQAPMRQPEQERPPDAEK